MDFCNRQNCNSVSKKNVIINNAGKDAVSNLEVCRDDCDGNAIVFGRVMNKCGQPIRNAYVKVVSETCEPICNTRTDCKGNYIVFNIPQNQSYRVIAIAETYKLSEEVKFCTKDQNLLNVDITLCCNGCNSAGAVTGTVLYRSMPINMAKVGIFEERGGFERLKNITNTNIDGQFLFSKLAFGTYLIKVYMDGNLCGRHRVKIIRCGQIVNLVFTVHPNCNGLKGTVSGRITDASQNPIPDADVILYKVEKDGKMTPIDFTRTNCDGVYLFINVGTGSYKVGAQ